MITMLNFERTYDNFDNEKIKVDTLPSEFSAILTWQTSEEIKEKNKREVDCDIFSVFLSDELFSGDKADIVYFARTEHQSGAIKFIEDPVDSDGNLRKSLKFKLKKIPENYDQIIIGVNIYEAKKRNQSFADMQNASVRLIVDDAETEIHYFDLTQDYSGKTSIYLADLKRENEDWIFNPIEIGSTDAYIEDFAQQFTEKKEQVKKENC